MPMLLEYRNEDVGAKLVFEDDGKTGYAYLIIDGKMVSDVWLYNVGESPEEPEWPDRHQMPFANPIGFVSDENFGPVTDQNEINVVWEVDSDCPVEINIFLKGRRHAMLRPGAKPGWCRLAQKSGPIAKPLNETT